MKNSELKLKVDEMLASGQKKLDVFNELKDQEGVKEKVLATLISAYPAPERLKKYSFHVYIIMFIVLLEAVLSFFAIHSMSELDGFPSEAVTFLYAFVAILSIAIIVRFYKNFAPIYGVFICLSIYGYVNGVIRNPPFDEVALFCTLFVAGTAFYVYYVQKKIFPDFGLFGPKKIGDEFVFTEDI